MRKSLLHKFLLFGALVLAWVNSSAQAIPDTDILSTPTEGQAKKGASKSDLELSFVQPGEELPPGVMYFNVLKILNNQEEAVTFRIHFELPPRSKIILQEKDQETIVLKSTESRFVPIRVSFPKDVEGGIDYKIGVHLRDSAGREIVPPAATSISYQKTSKWRISTPVSKTYSSSADESFTPVDFFLANEGNTREEIQLKFDAGSLLVMEESISGRFNMRVPLKPSSDTLVTVHVRCKPYDNPDRLGDKNRLRIDASSPNDTLVKDLLVIFESINESYQTALDESESPLVLSISQRNLTSRSSSTAINFSGNVLLKNERGIKYQLDFQHSFLDPKGGSATDMFWKKGRMFAEYSSPGNTLRIGDVSGGYGYSISGRGASWQHQWGKTQIGAVLARKADSPVWGLGTQISRDFNDKISLMGGLSYEQDNTERTRILSAALGSSFVLGEYQYLSVEASAIQQSPLAQAPDQATQRAFGYELGYNLNVGELSVELRNQYQSKDSPEGQGGTFQLEGEMDYALDFENSSLKMQYKGNLTYKPEKEDSTMVGQSRKRQHELSSFYNFKLGQLPFSIGGRWSHQLTEKTLFASDQGTPWGTSNLQLTLGTMIKGKNNGDISFVPTLQMGMASVTHSDNPEAIQQNNILTGKAGIAGRFKTGSVSAEYAYGPRAQLKQAVLANDPEYVHNLTMAFANQWDLIPEVLSLHVGGNAAYNLTDKELETQISSDLQYRRDDGWSFNLGASMDPAKMIRSSKNGESGGGPTLNAGARKAFDVPQPRLKYYTLELVFFRDYNGDREREKEDDGVSNVLVTAERSPDPIMADGGLKILTYNPPAIMSAPTGLVTFYRVPQGAYFLTLKELFPPTQYVNMSGADMEVMMDKHITLLIPYSKSVTITGKVEITRDKYSRLNGITPANIRISVMDANGEAYHTLTDDNGNYIISVPYSEKYQVIMKNVLGDKFDLVNAEQPIEVNEAIRYDISFHYKEKGRSINFGS